MGLFNLNFKAARKRPLALVVDDNPHVLELFCEMLSRLNCDTLRAENGAEALKLAEGKKPDLILLDSVMPNMSGIGVLRVLKKDPGTKCIPVIMVSGEQKGNDLDMAFNLGAADYIIKPVRKTELDEKVKAILSSIGFPAAH